MSRITVLEHSQANPEQQALLETIRRQHGKVPNIFGVLANSPVALQSVLGLRGVVSGGSLTPQTRERIALALAQQNACEYSLAVHTANGRKVGLTGDEIASNRAGTSEDARATVAVRLARSLSQHKGEISSGELIEAREAGYSDADIVEIIIHVGLSLLTNILGKASRIEVDFPKVALYTL
jgi:uncharacterized peroxidase-related enzyme